MRSNRWIAPLLAALVLSALPAAAHHSAAALYDVQRTVEIEGQLIQFSFRSPHSFVAVQAPDEAGRMQRWVVAWNAARQLTRQGVTRDFFKPGDIVIVRGHPGRNADDHIIAMTGIYRESDGFQWGDNPGEVFE